VAWSPDGLIASSSVDGSITVWDNDYPIKTLQHPRYLSSLSVANSVAWSPNGRLASAGCSETWIGENLSCYQGSIILWNPDNDQTTQINQGDIDWVNSVAWSHDGRLASGSDNGNVIIWDLESGQSSQTLQGHQDDVMSVAWSPNGRLASASEDRTVILWNLENGEPDRILQGHQGDVLSVAWSPNGKLASASADNTVIIWDLEVDQTNLTPQVESPTPKPVCQRAGRNLTWQEWQIYFPSEPYRKTCVQWPVHSSVITATIESGQELSQRGDIKGALEAYQEAQELDSDVEISAEQWNTLCWYGSLWGQPAKVMSACEQAIELEPENGEYREGRGLARALTGDYEGAIEDFLQVQESFRSVRHDRYEYYQRVEWITELAAGRNPFDEELLKELREE
jgi:tetratricopeptide (TPR) repeat protein